MTAFSMIENRLLLDSNYSNTTFWDRYWNQTAGDDYVKNQTEPNASDVSVDAVMTSLVFNAVIFVFLIASYEVLRRLLPAVYSARKMQAVRPNIDEVRPDRGTLERDDSITHIPEDSLVPLDWIGPVFGVSWEQVRKVGGLDGYFFLRFLRMCLRITSVSTFWAACILAPVFATGHNGEDGWFYFSINNVANGTWQMWVPTAFIYFFSGFCFFVMKQEYRHFIELRMHFLGKGKTKAIHPQHQYSLMVENIPRDLRSDTALFEYFNNLFPGKVYSANVVLKLPELEALSNRKLNVVRRLEKSIASFQKTGKRLVHIVGRGRISCLGIDVSPTENTWFDRSNETAAESIDDGMFPEKGARVDSITYYTRELAECNKKMTLLQKCNFEIAERGRDPPNAENRWVESVMEAASQTAGMIMAESLAENDLVSPMDSVDSFGFEEGRIVQAEQMTSLRYGSFGNATSLLGTHGSKVFSDSNTLTAATKEASDTKKTRLIDDDFSETNPGGHTEIDFAAPGSKEKERAFFRRMAGRLGLDFVFAGLSYAHRHVDKAVENLRGNTMSSTGFVTFLDHFSLSCAVSAPLTLKPNVLDVIVAPDPRDIRWEAIHTDKRMRQRRETIANILLFLGVIFWSIPLAAIQTFANAGKVAEIPGMEWTLTFHGGNLKSFINGYLPVVALLGLILILPVIFGLIATSFEKRKTLSDVQHSILGRYFYFQLANIYITVTAGSLWKSLADIIDRPSNVLNILGNSLPKVVGYFVSLLITKILAGLPLVTLRVGALGRMLFLRAAFNEESMTQRELDSVYRPENVLYGWEYPSQLLVIVICFTYACISPIILPVGAIYFFLALMVYKKQVLYVYTPIYESGGTFFPAACDRTLVGLLCGQLTFLGYIVIRKCYYQPLVLFPLPCCTIWVMRYFRKHYAVPSTRLSMERAMECDRVADIRASVSRNSPSAVRGWGAEESRNRFNKNAYRQPVLTEPSAEPMTYRRGKRDHLTSEAELQLNRLNRVNGSLPSLSHFENTTSDGSSMI